MIPSRCLPFSAEGEVPRTCVWRADGGMTPRARAGAGTGISTLAPRDRMDRRSLPWNGPGGVRPAHFRSFAMVSGNASAKRFASFSGTVKETRKNLPPLSFDR